MITNCATCSRSASHNGSEVERVCRLNPPATVCVDTATAAATNSSPGLRSQSTIVLVGWTCAQHRHQSFLRRWAARLMLLGGFQ